MRCLQACWDVTRADARLVLLAAQKYERALRHQQLAEQQPAAAARAGADAKLQQGGHGGGAALADKENVRH